MRSAELSTFMIFVKMYTWVIDQIITILEQGQTLIEDIEGGAIYKVVVGL